MARAVKIDLKELKQFSKQLENLQKRDRGDLYISY